jgi:hypothetical protein
MVADGIRESKDTACQMLTATEESLSPKADCTFGTRENQYIPKYSGTNAETPQYGGK